ncbi:MAG: hypothetical protein KF773_29805 [Deltaproteobacteria bacterium]|nr:hypothetical protein [Deltaproteobacteria bacterium]
MNKDRAIALAIFVATFAFYMLSSSREPAWGDARSMWDVADRLVADRTIATTVRWPDDAPPGQDGKYYGIAPIGTSLVHVPGAALARISHGISARHDGLARPLFVHLAPALLGALACAVFFLLLRDLAISAGAASVSTAILACATTTWVYARMPYSEILQLACFLGLFRATLRVANAPVRREALWWGVWAGCLLDAKYVFAAAIAGAALVIAWTLRARRRELLEVTKWAAVTGVPLVALALWYNWARWGSVTSTGYEPYLDAYFGGSVFDGAWGMLLSPNKSAFLYSPPLVLAVIALPSAVRAVPRLGLAMLAMVAPVFLVYATYRSWSGEWAWGPRFFVWAVPVMLVPLAWFVDAARTRWRRGVLGAVVALGLAVQVLGCALYWDHFIRIAIDVKNQWLGQPNRRGSYIADRGRGHCDSCFEDTYEVLWTPALHPIRGHWWLLKSIARGDDARSAQADAPWRGYTTLEMNLTQSYPRARVDWWGLLWIKDGKDLWGAGVAVLVALVGGLAFGIWRWLRLLRRHAME